jgi:hypothetical protein
MHDGRRLDASSRDAGMQAAASAAKRPRVNGNLSTLSGLSATTPRPGLASQRRVEKGGPSQLLAIGEWREKERALGPSSLAPPWLGPPVSIWPKQPICIPAVALPFVLQARLS